MRFIRIIFDLPWWSGLPIFLVGCAIVPHFTIIGYIVGLVISLFGCWIFSKLLNTDGEFRNISVACIFLTCFMLTMKIPYSFDFATEWLAFLNSMSPTLLYVIRASGGLFFAFLAFVRGFRK